MTVHPKVISSVVATAALGILWWILSARFGINVPDDIKVDGSVVAVFLAGWLTPSGDTSITAPSSASPLDTHNTIGGP